DIGHLGTQSARDSGAAAARDFELAEIAGKRHLPLVVELLAAKHQHGITVDRLRQGLDRGLVERLAGIDPSDLGGEQRMQLADAQRHSDLLSRSNLSLNTRFYPAAKYSGNAAE